MNTDKELTGEIIEAAIEVHNTLGCGLLEKVYEDSLMVELRLNILNCVNLCSSVVKTKGRTYKKL